MVEPVNPYAPPTDAIALHPPMQGFGYQDGFWREGDQLVVPRSGARLPDRCVKCNAPAEHTRLSKTFQWHARWIYITIVVSWLVYLILALIMRKSVQVEFGLCDEHAQKRQQGMIIGWGGGVLSLVLLVVGIGNELVPLIIVSIVGLLAAIIAGSLMARTLYPSKMDDSYAWLKAGEPFLNSLGGPHG